LKGWIKREGRRGGGEGKGWRENNKRERRERKGETISEALYKRTNILFRALIHFPFLCMLGMVCQVFFEHGYFQMALKLCDYIRSSCAIMTPEFDFISSLRVPHFVSFFTFFPFTLFCLFLFLFFLSLCFVFSLFFSIFSFIFNSTIFFQSYATTLQACVFNLFDLP
jgi:hypothetical protein